LFLSGSEEAYQSKKGSISATHHADGVEHSIRNWGGFLVVWGRIECVALAGCDLRDKFTIGQCDALWCYNIRPETESHQGKKI